MKLCEKCTARLYKNECRNPLCPAYHKRVGEAKSYIYPEQLRCPDCGEFVSFKTCFCTKCNKYLESPKKRENMRSVDLCKKCHMWTCDGYQCTGSYNGGDYTEYSNDYEN